MAFHGSEVHTRVLRCWFSPTQYNRKEPGGANIEGLSRIH